MLTLTVKPRCGSASDSFEFSWNSLKKRVRWAFQESQLNVMEFDMNFMEISTADWFPRIFLLFFRSSWRSMKTAKMKINRKMFASFFENSFQPKKKYPKIQKNQLNSVLHFIQLDEWSLLYKRKKISHRMNWTLVVFPFSPRSLNGLWSKHHKKAIYVCRKGCIHIIVARPKPAYSLTYARRPIPTAKEEATQSNNRQCV